MAEKKSPTTDPALLDEKTPTSAAPAFHEVDEADLTRELLLHAKHIGSKETHVRDARTGEDLYFLAHPWAIAAHRSALELHRGRDGPVVASLEAAPGHHGGMHTVLYRGAGGDESREDEAITFQSVLFGPTEPDWQGAQGFELRGRRVEWTQLSLEEQRGDNARDRRLVDPATGRILALLRHRHGIASSGRGSLVLPAAGALDAELEEVVVLTALAWDEVQRRAMEAWDPIPRTGVVAGIGSIGLRPSV